MDLSLTKAAGLRQEGLVSAVIHGLSRQNRASGQREQIVSGREKSVKWLSSPEAMPGLGQEAVYVATCAGFVKVGRSSSPATRFPPTAYPLDIVIEFLVIIPGHISVEVEIEAHMALAAHRHRGEWFTCPLEIAVKAVTDAASRVARAPAETRAAVRASGWSHAALAVIDF